MTPLETIRGILRTNLPYQSYVANGRADRLAVEILAELPMVDRGYHNAAVETEVRHQHRWADKVDAAEREATRLRDALNLASAERMRTIVNLVRGDALRDRNRSAKHDETCWQRHTGCLAMKISDLLADHALDDPEIEPGGVDYWHQQARSAEDKLARALAQRDEETERADLAEAELAKHREAVR